MMKTAAPSSECSFPFSNIKYVDCSLSLSYDIFSFEISKVE